MEQVLARSIWFLWSTLFSDQTGCIHFEKHILCKQIMQQTTSSVKYFFNFFFCIERVIKKTAYIMYHVGGKS